MGQEPELATKTEDAGPAGETAIRTSECSVTWTTALSLAAWIGLAAGFLDMGLMVVNRRWVQQDAFFRIGGHFTYLIPLAVTIVVCMPAIVLVLVSRFRRGSIRLGVLVGVLALVGILDASARLPLAPWAALLLAGGLAVQLARIVGRRPCRVVTLVRRTLPLLAGVWLAIMAATIGMRAWAEHRATINLPPPPKSARNVLLIVWDTVRFANLSLNGYHRRTTPNLERLARLGTRFDMAFSTSCWTLPAHASLFTGRWPHQLGVDWKSPLRGNVPTLAEYLAAHGYDTAGFVANLDYCNRETGLARGFAHYEDFPFDPFDLLARYTALGTRIDITEASFVASALLRRIGGRWYDLGFRAKEHAKSAQVVNQGFLSWLARRTDRGRPFFAFLNYNDAHTPYEVPDRTAPAFGIRPASSWDRLTLHGWTTTDKATLSYHDVQLAIDVYDDCIAYLDGKTEALLQELKRQDLLDETLVVVMADHGEHLGDHLLFFHGCSLYRQLVQVPLLIVDTAQVPGGRIVHEPVSVRDIPATVVDLLGLEPRGTFPGRSLARFWNQQGDRGNTPLSEPLLMETGKPELLANQGREPAAKGRMNAIVAGGAHYIRSGDGSEELYLLNSDPEERLNVSSSAMAQELIEGFRKRLAAMLATQ